MPFKPGDAISMSIKFAPKVDIDGGKLTLALALRGQKLFETTADLCGDTALNCPLPAGQEVRRVPLLYAYTMYTYILLDGCNPYNPP